MSNSSNVSKYTYIEQHNYVSYTVCNFIDSWDPVVYLFSSLPIGLGFRCNIIQLLLLY